MTQINHQKNIENTRILILDSQNGEFDPLSLDPSEADLTFSISPAIPRVIGVRVVDFQYPFRFWTFTTNTVRTITWLESGTPYSVLIDVGTYTFTSLATAAQNAMNAASPGFTVTFSPTTFRMTVAKATFDTLISVGLGSDGNITGSGPSFTFPWAPLLNHPTYVRCDCESLAPFLKKSDDALAVMQMGNTQPGEMITYKPVHNTPLFAVQPQTISQLHTVIFSSTGAIVQPHNLHWSMTLELTLQ
jgi:hypothetical protein